MNAPTTDEVRAWSDDMRERTRQLPNGRAIVECGWQLAGFGIHRDSEPLDESNYGVAMRELARVAGIDTADVSDLGMPWLDDDETGADEEPIAVAHFGHFAVGWIDELIVRSDRSDLIAEAMTMRTYIDEQYPVLDDVDYCEREWSANHPSDTECYSDDEDCPCAARQSEREQ